MACRCLVGGAPLPLWPAADMASSAARRQRYWLGYNDPAAGGPISLSRVRPCRSLRFQPSRSRNLGAERRTRSLRRSPHPRQEQKRRISARTPPAPFKPGQEDLVA